MKEDLVNNLLFNIVQIGTELEIGKKKKNYRIFQYSSKICGTIYYNLFLERLHLYLVFK